MRFYGSSMPLQQWEIGRKLEVDDAVVGDEVHFTSLYHTTVTKVKIVEEDGHYIVEVPYFLLQKPGYVYGYRYHQADGVNLAGVEFKFPVKASEKPAGYPYEEVEVSAGGGSGGGSALHVYKDATKSTETESYATHTAVEINAALEAGREVLFCEDDDGLLHNSGVYPVAHLRASHRNDYVRFVGVDYESNRISIWQYDIDRNGLITEQYFPNNQPIHLTGLLSNDGSVGVSSSEAVTMGETFGPYGLLTFNHGVVFSFYDGDSLDVQKQTTAYKADYRSYASDKTVYYEFYLDDGVIVKCTSVESTAEDARYMETVDTWSIDRSQVGTGGSGNDGVGIESIVQTTKSTDDDGVNVITVTLTDGRTQTFEIENGSKGDKGDAGSANLPTYTEADYGKMLTPTADGLVWADPPQGSGGSGEAIPSAEGVEF